MGKFLERNQIEDLQLRKLRSLLDAVLPSNPFYARKLTPGAAMRAAASLSEFADAIPFTSRHDLVKDRLDHPPYGTGLTYPVERYVRCHQTSGRPPCRSVGWIRESWDHIVENWLEIFAAAGVTAEDRFFFAFPSAHS